MTWVLFDYGNVISLPQPEPDMSALARAAGRPAAEFTPAYWEYRLDYDRGELDATTYWQKVAATLGLTFSSGQVAALTLLDAASWMHLDEQTVGLIHDLATAGHRLALLSNAPTEVAEAVAALPIAARFEHCFFSCYLRSAKPDPAVFLAVLDGLGASPDDVIFLDDRAENVAGAVAVGMRAVHFTSASHARTELARFGALPQPGTPGAEEPGRAAGRPGQKAMAAQNPGRNEPGLGEPRRNDPGLGAPGLGAPGLGAPGRGAPGLGERGAGERDAAGAGLAAPAPREPSPEESPLGERT